MKKTLHTKQYQVLTSWLRTKREERGLTVRELAYELDVSHSLVGKVEQGERRLDVIEFITYCNALNLDIEESILILKKL